MTTIIDQYFKTAEGKSLGMMRRTLNVNFTPILNAYLEDSVWKKEKKINKIIINPLGGYYALVIDEEIIDEAQRIDIKKSYEDNGWVEIIK